MSTGSLSGLGVGPSPDDQMIVVYYHAARNGSVASVDAAAAELGLEQQVVSVAVERLTELRMLRADGDGRLVPVAPEVAAAQLISPIEREIYQRRELADQLRERIDTVARPGVGDQASVGTIQPLTGRAEIRGLLKVASDSCRDELLILRSDQEQGEELDELLDACHGALERSVDVRVICAHRSRGDFAARARVSRLTDSGAVVRTTHRMPKTAVVFDRILAVVFGIDEDLQPTARRVRDDDVVRFLVELFDQLWDDAAPFTTGDVGYADDVTEDIQQSIARLMAQGLTDEVVARRLGMSVRTCRQIGRAHV